MTDDGGQMTALRLLLNNNKEPIELSMGSLFLLISDEGCHLSSAYATVRVLTHRQVQDWTSIMVAGA